MTYNPKQRRKTRIRKSGKLVPEDLMDSRPRYPYPTNQPWWLWHLGTRLLLKFDIEDADVR
jgi:hypothetical protein